MSDVDWKRVGELLAEGVREQFEEAGRLILANAPEPLPDPTVPHGYPSWKDYALVLQHEAKINGATIDRYVDQCGELESQVEQLEAELKELRDDDEGATDPPQGYSTWLEYYQTQAQRREPDERMQALIDENEELRARVSRQRRELKQVNRCIREQKLELEVLRGRNRQQEKTLRYALDANPVVRGPEWFTARTALSDVIRAVDGFASRNECAICTDPACEEPNGKH